MNIFRTKNTIVALEGFAISVVFHLIGGFLLAPKLEMLFPEMPLLTIAMLSSSTFSTFITILYLWLRLRFVPKVVINKDVVLFSISGTLLACLVAFLSIAFIGSTGILLAKKVASLKQPYFLPTLSLLVLWGPCLEEILYRGYFFEIISKDYSKLTALLLSSLLFSFFHGIFGSFNIGLVFVFLYSVVFTFAYMGGGIVSSVTSHALLNYYLYFIND